MSQLIDPQIASSFDRLPPHDVPAEQCLIASMLLDKECIGTAIEIVPHKDYFYQTDHQIFYTVLVELWQESTPIDVVTLRDALIKRGLYEECGGAAYLGQLLNTVPSSA